MGSALAARQMAESRLSSVEAVVQQLEAGPTVDKSHQKPYNDGKQYIYIYISFRSLDHCSNQG